MPSVGQGFRLGKPASPNYAAKPTTSSAGHFIPYGEPQGPARKDTPSSPSVSLKVQREGSKVLEDED